MVEADFISGSEKGILATRVGTGAWPHIEVVAIADIDERLSFVRHGCVTP